MNKERVSEVDEFEKSLKNTKLIPLVALLSVAVAVAVISVFAGILYGIINATASFLGNIAYLMLR